VFFFLFWIQIRFKIDSPSAIAGVAKIALDNPLFQTFCTALLTAELFIEPPPDTQRTRRRGERGTGVAKGSYLFLTSLSLPPSPHTARLLHRLGPRHQD
jgi:hypothetical protein